MGEEICCCPSVEIVRQRRNAARMKNFLNMFLLGDDSRLESFL